jgi:hypothetical protein
MRRRILVAVPLMAVAAMVGGCHGSSQQYATPAPDTVASTSQKRAIAAVLASPVGQDFGFFPKHVGRGRCVIHGGPVPRLLIRGVCWTRVLYNWGGGGPLVVFSETWPWRSFHYGSAPERPQRHLWRFVIDYDHVRAAGQSGDVPPQYVKCRQSHRHRTSEPAPTPRGLICLLERDRELTFR